MGQLHQSKTRSILLAVPDDLSVYLFRFCILSPFPCWLSNWLLSQRWLVLFLIEIIRTNLANKVAFTSVVVFEGKEAINFEEVGEVDTVIWFLLLLFSKCVSMRLLYMIIVIVIVLVPVFRKSHDQTFHIVVFFFFRDIHNRVVSLCSFSQSS